MKRVKWFGAVIIAVGLAVALVSCGGGGGGGGGGGSSSGGTTAAASGSYSGSFSVNGASYNSLTMENGSFNLASNTGSDITGTYAAASGAMADATYLLTYSVGSFTVAITSNGNTVTFSKGSGTLNASGTGSGLALAGWWKGTGNSPQNNNRPFIQYVHVSSTHVRYVFFDNGRLTDDYYVPITLSGNTISYDLHNASPVPAIPYSASFNFAVNGSTLTVSNLNIVGSSDHYFDNGQTTMNYTRIYTR
ncbi:MAG: hypothetical protein J5631_00470 [Spirochaetaceae bacterium]|nr:hypothetical protein [Spirochaetaceae bacterium]